MENYKRILSLFLQKADLAVADLTITYEREQGVDFTMPFMNLGENPNPNTLTYYIHLCIIISTSRFWYRFQSCIMYVIFLTQLEDTIEANPKFEILTNLHSSCTPP